MPIGNSFSGWFVGVEGSQLGQWNCHVSAVPPDQHEHIVGAGVDPASNPAMGDSFH